MEGEMSFEQAAEMSVAELQQTPDKGSADTPTTETAAPVKETAPESKPDALGIDPTKLPAEVLPFYKEMQSAFTKKMQALSETMEGFTPHRERLAMLDKAIAGDPQALENLRRIAGTPAAPAQDAAKDPYGDIPETFETTKDLMQFVDKRAQSIAQSIIDRVMPSVTAPIQDMQQKAMEQRAIAEIEGLKSKYPDFEKHIPDILRFRQDNGPVPLEACYKAVTWSPKVPASQLTPQPGASPKAISPKSNAKSIDEAFEMAMATLGGKG